MPLIDIDLRILLPYIPIAASFAIGLIFERVIFAKLEALAAQIGWKTVRLLISSFKGMITLWFTLGGMYLALPTLPITPEVTNTLSKIILIVAILSATRVLMRVVSNFVATYTKEILPTSTTIFKTLTQFIVLILGLLIILQSLGIAITPIIATLGIGGLAVALALQDTLSNLFAGFHILASKQVKPGDYVKLNSGQEGYVVDINWRNTTIKMLPNNLVVVPNSKLASSIITNYYLPEKELAVLIDVGVSYDSDLEKVEEVTLDVAKEVMNDVSGGISGFEPFIRYHTFDDFSINFTVIMKAEEFVDQYLVKHEFIKRLHKRYKEEGIKIPFPIRTVYLHETK